MKLTYFGTGASEGVPAVFCDCEMCAYARKAGGEEIRTRAGALVDDALKIDYCADAYMQSLKCGVKLSGLRHLLITHSHRDHYCPEELENFIPPYAKRNPGDGPLTVYGNENVCALLAPFEKKGLLESRALSPNREYEIDGYLVTPLKAEHMPSETALFYLIEKGGKALLYAHDTDCFTPEHFALLKRKKLSMVSLDCTNGVLETSYAGHMGVKDNLNMREALLEIGAADAHTIFAANHFSHNGLVPAEKMRAALPGFTIARDGLTIEF